MIGIEGQVYLNKWRAFHPRDKIIFAILTMMLGMLSRSPIQALLIILGMTSIIVFMVKVPLGFYLKLLAVPGVFLVFTVLAVSISISSNPQPMLWNLTLGSFYLGMTQEGIRQALLLLVRSTSSISCLFFLALTTPIEDLAGQLERWRTPYVLIELMSLVYRFLFIFWEQATTIQIAQASRLGYVDIKTGIRSLAFLLSGLFVQALNRANSLHNALVARGYTDSLKVMTEEYKSTPRPVFFSLLSFDLVLLGFIIFKGSAWF